MLLPDSCHMCFEALPVRLVAAAAAGKTKMVHFSHCHILQTILRFDIDNATAIQFRESQSTVDNI